MGQILIPGSGPSQRIKFGALDQNPDFETQSLVEKTDACLSKYFFRSLMKSNAGTMEDVKKFSHHTTKKN